MTKTKEALGYIVVTSQVRMGKSFPVRIVRVVRETSTLWIGEDEKNDRFPKKNTRLSTAAEVKEAELYLCREEAKREQRRRDAKEYQTTFQEHLSIASRILSKDESQLVTLGIDNLRHIAKWMDDIGLQ